MLLWFTLSASMDTSIIRFCSLLTALKRIVVLSELLIGIDIGAPPRIDTPIMEFRQAAREGYHS